MPQFKAVIKEGKIAEIKVLRGAPCGATWEAAEKIIGLPVEEAIIRMGLETQFFCSADPSNWDPIHGKSPVHYAAELHSRALEKAVKESNQ